MNSKEKSLDEIVQIGQELETYVTDIVNNFCQTINKTLEESQLQDITTLTRLLVMRTKDDAVVPVIANLNVGQGKSTLLLEFIKYMCSVDENFSAVIVKRTLEEAKDFVISLGIMDKEFESLFLESYASRKEEYEGTSGFINGKEDIFIARLIRGFNLNDCQRYADGTLESSGEDLNEYTHNLCSGCQVSNCKVKQSKWYQKKHRIAVITHARLFLSNDYNEIINDIGEWENNKGETQKRRLLIIDEKIETFYMDTVKLKEWTVIKDQIISSNLGEDEKNQIREVNTFLNQLSFPETSNTIKKIEPYMNGFKFNSNILNLLFVLNKNIRVLEKLLTVERFLSNGGTIGRAWGITKDELISYCKYINIRDYQEGNYEKCIILDATSKNDLDYCKSDFAFINEIGNGNKFDVTIYKNTIVNASKTKIIGDGKYDTNVKDISYELYELIQKFKTKTLIVLYKDIRDYNGNVYHFKEDVQEQLGSYDLDNEYKIVHFGQYTTGVNHFKDYETIIIIGQLNKGSYYYQNKGLCLSITSEEIQCNEYLIDMIQQIGRTAIRQDKKVNVCLIGCDDTLINQLKDYFNANVYTLLTQYYVDDVSYAQLMQYVAEKINKIGDVLLKADLKNYFVNYIGMNAETFRKALAHSTFKEFLNENCITDKKNNRRFEKLDNDEFNAIQG